MSEYTKDEKREAFAAWDAYRPRFIASIQEIVRIPGAGPTLLDNPLVMIIYADAYLAGKRAATPMPPTPLCEHEGCTNPGEPCWLPDDPEDAPSCHYCVEHMHDGGFCPGCRLFWGGVESFEFGRSGLCDNCRGDPDHDDEAAAGEDDDPWWPGMPDPDGAWRPG